MHIDKSIFTKNTCLRKAIWKTINSILLEFQICINGKYFWSIILNVQIQSPVVDQ